MISKIDDLGRKEIYSIIEQEVFSDEEKYKFFMSSCKMKPIKNSSFEKYEFVSHVEGRIQGYFAYLYDLVNQKVTNIELISFEENAVFMRDFLKFCKYLDETFKNIELAIIPESPAYRMATLCFSKYKLRRIGTLTSSMRLCDGKRYDVEIWQKRGDVQ